MKIFQRILLVLSLLIAIVLITSAIILNNLKTSALPDYNKNVDLTGLAEEVTVSRDEHGTAHINAKNEKDLYRAVGFSMAQDRLWQMDLLRRVTQGRLSEILGKDQINTDLLMRALRIQEKSERIIATLEPEIVTALEAFSDGVNQYIGKNPLPPEFKVLRYKPEQWKPVHSINLIGYMAWDLSMGWGTEYFLHQLKKEISDAQIQELLPNLGNHKTAVYSDLGAIKIQSDETLLSATKNLKELGLEILNGSNNWAVSGKKSKTGLPLLANDMHLGLFAPGIWYQMHQTIDGKLNVAGVVLPGQPFIIAGHNSSIAWGMTNVMVDDLDFYAEILNDDSTKYLLDGEWKNLTIKKEIIKTKEGEEFEEILKFTHRGPIVNRFKQENEKPLSVRWLGNEKSSEIRTVYLLNRAKNWADFRDAVKTFKSVSQNIVYADIDGNIGLQCSAGIPIRAGSGIQIYPGDSSKYDWTGLVPFEELPFEFNPERGFVSSANNKTTPNSYPYYISNWFAPPNRIDRIREMLNEKEKFDVENFMNMQRDVKSNQAQKMLPVFLHALNMEPDFNEQQKIVLSKLKNWDFNLTRESQAASVYEILFRKVCENLVKDDLSENLYNGIKGQRMLLENLILNILSENKSVWIDNVKTNKTETFDDIIIQSFKETVEDLSNELGADIEEWNWGKIHTFTVSHPLGVVSALDKLLKLNRGPFEMPGSYHTVCPYSYSYNNLYNTNHGASHRHIYDVSNWDDSKTIIPTGTSGIPASDFYLDQTNMYINNQYHEDPFSKAAVKNAARFKMIFIPK